MPRYTTMWRYQRVSSTTDKRPALNARILAFLPALLIMAAIFFFSSQPADDSDAVSGLAGYQIFSAANRVFGLGLDPAELLAITAKYQHPIRKTAHFTEYMFLGISVLFGISVNFRALMSGPIRAGGTALLITAAYAASDEIHQLFVPGRAGRVSDCLIDSLGALFGITVYLLLYGRRHHAEDRRKTEA